MKLRSNNDFVRSKKGYDLKKYTKGYSIEVEQICNNEKQKKINTLLN